MNSKWCPLWNIIVLDTLDYRGNPNGGWQRICCEIVDNTSNPKLQTSPDVMTVL